jgi:YHS domain-containing protein
MKSLAFAAVLVAFSAPVFAGPQYIDETKFAVSGYDVVAYRSLTQSPVGQSQPEAVPGSPEFTADYNGATFAFANAANRDLFQSNPAYYAPQFDGHCAYGVSKGGKVPANPHLWRIIDDKLYLNITKNVVGFWEENIPGNISLADNNWVSIEGDGASTRTIPNFSSPAPVK